MIDKKKVAQDTVDLLNKVRALEFICGLPPLSDEQEDARDAMMFRAVSLMEEDKQKEK